MISWIVGGFIYFRTVSLLTNHSFPVNIRSAAVVWTRSKAFQLDLDKLIVQVGAASIKINLNFIVKGLLAFSSGNKIFFALPIASLLAWWIWGVCQFELLDIWCCVTLLLNALFFFICWVSCIDLLMNKIVLVLAALIEIFHALNHGSIKSICCCSLMNAHLFVILNA